MNSCCPPSSCWSGFLIFAFIALGSVHVEQALPNWEVLSGERDATVLTEPKARCAEICGKLRQAPRWGSGSTFLIFFIVCYASRKHLLLKTRDTVTKGDRNNLYGCSYRSVLSWLWAPCKLKRSFIQEALLECWLCWQKDFTQGIGKGRGRFKCTHSPRLQVQSSSSWLLLSQQGWKWCLGLLFFCPRKTQWSEFPFDESFSAGMRTELCFKLK